MCFQIQVLIIITYALYIKMIHFNACKDTYYKAGSNILLRFS